MTCFISRVRSFVFVCLFVLFYSFVVVVVDDADDYVVVVVVFLCQLTEFYICLFHGLSNDDVGYQVSTASIIKDLNASQDTTLGRWEVQGRVETCLYALKKKKKKKKKSIDGCIGTHLFIDLFIHIPIYPSVSLYVFLSV